MTILEIIGLLFLTTAILWDLLSLYLYLVSNKRGHGSSGVPVVSWFIYFYYFSAAVATGTLSTGTALLMMTTLTIFHALCHYVIPVLH
jgi:hypothetical protein